jgi:hypothetical protein
MSSSAPGVVPNPAPAPDTAAPQENKDPNTAEPPEPPEPPEARHHEKFLEDDFFGHQPSTRSQLPDPVPLLKNLTRCVIEVLAGARDLEQITRWVSDDVHSHLLKRVALSARARAVKGQKVQRPIISIGKVTISEPRDGVIEAVVIVHNKVRVRAVAVRIEGFDQRWRASAINIL